MTSPINHQDPPGTLLQAKLAGMAPWQDLESASDLVRVFRDRYPVTVGHLLFVPEQDTLDNITEAFRVALKRGNDMVQSGDCDAFNIGINMGTAAGQTVMYPHVHFIPRCAGDCDDPVGGVRGVVPGQANYKKPCYQPPNK